MKALKAIMQAKERERLDKAGLPKSAVILDETEQTSLDKFVELFESSWVSNRDTSRNIETDGFHPSSLGIKHGKCARRGVYLLRGVAKSGEPDSRLMRIFATGHTIHALAQGHLETLGIKFESEVKISTEEPPIRGHCDGVLEWDDEQVALEIKTCSEEVFNNRIIFHKPKDEHVEQVNIYAHVLGIEKIFVLYWCKNTQRVKVFQIATDHVKAQKQIDAWHAQWLAFKAGELPRRPFKPTSPTCAVCDLKEYCFADDEQGIDLKPYKDTVKELHATV